MTSLPSPASTPESPRRELARLLGPDRMKALHRPAPLLDAAVLLGLCALFVAAALALARLRFGALWLAALVIQGFVIQGFGYLGHEMGVHRRVGGARLASLLRTFTFFAVLHSPAAYVHKHVRHHRYQGADEDEPYKQDLDRRWKRLLILTFPGAVLAHLRLLRPRTAVAAAASAAWQAPERVAARIRREVVALAFAWGLVAGLITGGCHLLFWGYLLPLVLVVPVVGAVRIALEHSETDPNDPYHCAIHYRTGLLSRLLFFGDAGDCHIVHHLFPGIPFYRMGAALASIKPILLARGVPERTSLAQILHRFFWRGVPHRTVWDA